MALNVVSAASQTLCTPEKRRRHASGDELSSDRDSGESLFITQSAASETKKVIRRKPAAPSQSVSDEKSKNGMENCSPEVFLKRWQCLGDFMITPKKRYTKPKRNGPRKRFRPIKAAFPFLLKSQKQQHLSLQKHQVLENSEMGGFFKCIKKMHKSKGSPNMLEFVPSDDLDEETSDREVTVVNKAGFVLNKIKQKWLTQSILERRVQDAEDENLQNQSETLEVLCSDSELSDNDGSEQAYIIRLGDEESDGGHVWLVEDTQRLTQAVHEAPRMNTERNSSSLTQGGDAAMQNHAQHSGTETLLPDEDKSEAGKNHRIAHKTAGLDLEESLLFMQNSDQDSDITEIDGLTGEYVSKSGPGTPRQKGKSRAHSKAADETTQHSSQTISVSSKAPSLVTGEQEENADDNQCSDSQDASQSLLDSHAEPTSERKKIKSQKKRKKMSGKDVEVADEDTVIDPASGPVELARNAFPAVETGDSPLFKPVELGFLTRKKKRKKTDTIQRETNVDASSNDVTGLITKHKDDERKSREDNRTNEEQSCDTSRLSVGSDSTDISQVKKKKAKKQKLEERDDAEPSVDTQNAQDSGSVSRKAKKKRKYDNATFNLSNGSMEDSSKPGSRLSYSSRGEKTSEPLETTRNVVASDSTTVKKKKKQKMKAQDKESVETAQHNESQTAVLSSKKTKKNKKTERTTCDEETTNVAENLEMRLKPMKPEDTQTTEETEGCSSPGVTLLKSGKKKKKSNGSERPDEHPVSQEENGLSTQEFEERASDVRQHLKSNTGDALNDAKRKKKRIVSQSEETPERRKKKNKGHSNGLIEDSSELHTNHEVSGNLLSLMATPSEMRPKKRKKKKNEEVKEADQSTSPLLLAKGQTDSVIEENNAEKQVRFHSGEKIKKRKKDIELTDNDCVMEMISSSQVNQSDTPKRPKKEKNSQDASQSLLDLHAEPTSEIKKIKSQKKSRKMSGKDVADEDTVIDPASGPVEVARNAFPTVETGDSPLFKPFELGFLTRKKNNAEKQVTGNSGVKIKKRKKDIEFTDNDMEMISSSQVIQSDTPKRPKKERQKNRCDDEETCAKTVLQANKIKDRKKKCKQTGDAENVSAMEDHSESRTDDVSLSKKKKRKSKVENVSIQDIQNSSICSEAEGIETFDECSRCRRDAI
ncbi:aspartoacylase isoform X2 [Triplophysa rosa]|uniref:aspartoacylase isoform X2 n=1 Tax=Triplophysa rosa TaxID=992332 RepID=UPI0025461E86|nr:aspartoacylase isoform X2 [Triplophysa rosa]